MPFIGLAFIIQLAFAIHAVKTGREIFWVYIIMFLPGIGAGLYFFTQVLPEMGQSRAVHNAKNSLLKAIDPQRELRKKKAQLELTNTLDNKLKLAEECLDATMLDDAIELFKSCLKGLGEGDANTLVKLAQAYFANKEYQKAIDTLNECIQSNPNYNSTDGHLLFARCLEHLKRFDEALKEYAIVSENFAGEEARIRYALLLLQVNKNETAKKIFQQSVSRSKLAPKFYQKKEKHWTKIANSHLKQL